MSNLGNHIAISKHASLVVWELDQNRVYTSSVGGGLSVLGLTSQDIVGKNHSELHAQDKDALENVDRAYQGEEFTAEAIVNGRTFSTNYIPKKDTEGKIIGLMAVSVDVTEEKKKEKILESEREHLNTIFDLSPAFMAIVVGKDHIFQKTNQRYQDLIGNRNIIGLPLSIALPEIQNQGFDKILDDVLTTGKPYIGKEVPVKLLINGITEELYLDFIYQQLKDENGNGIGVYVHGIDVTDNVLAEAELKAFIETMPQIAFIADAKGDITYFNRHWYEYINGMKGTEGWGWIDKNIHHPDDLQRAIDRWTYSIKTGEPYEIEYRLRRHDGEYRWYLARATAIRNTHGDILRWVGTNTDIHDQKTEQEISKLIIETIPQGIWRGSPDGAADYFSERFYEIVGYSSEEFLGWSWTQYIHPEDKPRVLEIWAKGLEGRTKVSADFRILMKDGSYRWFLSLGNPFFNENGELQSYYGTWTDVHEQKLQEGRLSLAVKSRDEFLSIASHELKTPLTSLRLHSQLVVRTPLREQEKINQIDRIKNFATNVDRQVTRLNRLVEDMLDVSRIETGKLTFKKKEMDLVSLLQETVERMIPQYIQKKVQPPLMHLSLTKVIGIWDSERLEQVINNILSNALRYGEGKPVQVTLQYKDNAVEIGFHDHGQGISKEMIRAIFEKFDRGDESTENTGLGLGLFISKQIIEAHDGKIEVVSEPNKGSSFFIRLFDAVTIS